MNGRLDNTKLLVEGGAEVEARNQAGATPAAEAENAGHLEVGEWLFVVMSGNEGNAEEGMVGEEGGLENGNGRGERQEEQEHGNAGCDDVKDIMSKIGRVGVADQEEEKEDEEEGVKEKS